MALNLNDEEVLNELLKEVPKHHQAEYLKFAKTYIEGLGDTTHRKESLDSRYVRFIEPIEVFVNSPFYLDKEGQVYPKVMEAMVDICAGNYEEIVLTGGIGCVTADTEYLTPHGWVRIDSYFYGTPIAVFDPYTKQVSFKKPNDYVTFLEDEVRVFEGDWYSQRLSNNHRVLCYDDCDTPVVKHVYDIVKQVREGVSFSESLPTTFSVAGGPGTGLTTNELLRRLSLLEEDFVWAWDCNNQELTTAYNVFLLSKNIRTNSRSAIDFVQYVFTTRGITTVITESESEDKCFSIRVSPDSPKLTVHDEPKVEKTPDGKVYCFNTDTGYFITRHNGKICATGNSAKTTIALFLQAYQLYQLSCLKNPQIEYGLDSSSEIIIVFQSLNKELAKAVDYKRFRDMIGGSPYFQKHFMFNTDLESSMVFPNRIEVKPVAGTESAAIGQNVIGGIIDEINYMSVVSRSMQSVDRGTFDQALALYNSIARRRESRFIKNGKLPGVLCLVSSKRYPGQFTDKKEAEAAKQLAETGKTSIYIYDKRVWDIKPKGTFSGEVFKVFAGDQTRRPRILNPEEIVAKEDNHLVVDVPVEFKKAFEEDIINALREIAGVSTLALYPYMLNVNAISRCFGLRESIFDTESTDFIYPKLGIYPQNITNKQEPRFVHIDLAVSGDSCGFCIGYVKKFIAVESGDSEVEVLPEIHIDGMLEIRPPQGGEIEFAKVRQILYTLQKAGMYIKWVTFDSFQSVDSIQILRRKGFISDVKSVDRTPIPYELTKNAFYSNRLKCPNHEKCYMELISLEKDPKTGKIDHPTHSSKDVSDALAGVVFGLTTRREIWVNHDVGWNEIPDTLLLTLNQGG